MSEEFPKRYDFKSTEPKLRDYWKEKGVYKFTLEESDKWEDIFSVDTPPPFTSGNMHLGHVLNFCWIDFMARFRRMQGKKVYLPQGFDCHGLPTELKVQRMTNIDPHTNRHEFREACIKITEEFIEQMMAQFDLIGYSTDWDHTYRTMNPNYVRLVQESLLEFHEKGMFYQAAHPIHWCSECQTALAKQEVGYIDKEGHLWEIKLPVHKWDENDPDEHVVIATTRPEMMEACVAVFVHPNDDRYYHLSSAYVDIPFTDRKVRIYASKEVDMNFGTGVVYCCTFGDEQDINWVNEHDLESYQIITYDGKMADFSKFAGMSAAEAQKEIVKRLDEMGLLVSEKSFPHRVICHTERSSCLTPIEYLPIPQWFIKVADYTERIKEMGKDLEWYPDMHIRRLEDWCDSLTWDWVISRQRVFGTPIPVWHCENPACDFYVLAKKEDLPLDPVEVPSPVEKCPECGDKVIGEDNVCDCWIDSSITPLRIAKWHMDETFFNKVYPTTNRPQGYEIIRTWLFYTLFRSEVLTGKPPFSEILINGMVPGPDGRKMSKTFGNIISPDEVIPFYGADPIRHWAALAGLGSDYPFNFHYVRIANKQKFNLEQIKKQRKKMSEKKFLETFRKDSQMMKDHTRYLTKIWNAYRLVFMNVKEIDLEDLSFDASELTAIDHFMLSQFNSLAQQMHDLFDVYNWKDAAILYRQYFWGIFCDYYLESVKHRFDEKEPLIYSLIQNLGLNLLIVYALVLPYIYDEIFLRMFKKYVKEDSVHQLRWPEAYEGISEEKALLGKIALALIGEIRNQKAKAKKALNSPVKKAVVVVPSASKLNYDAISDSVKATIQVEELVFEKGTPKGVLSVPMITPDEENRGLQMDVSIDF